LLRWLFVGPESHRLNLLRLNGILVCVQRAQPWHRVSVRLIAFAMA
jgi:hypothetical protein